eukprot:gb/GECG01006439.1/.p1 GENE.gb/GECG01006439.1/~~gb/GECG01006439.1/.p1  ORF type:complete len:511 (+),score=44.29 gb/GECG01006439.1/:1-1533(+)
MCWIWKTDILVDTLEWSCSLKNDSGNIEKSSMTSTLAIDVISSAGTVLMALLLPALIIWSKQRWEKRHDWVGRMFKLVNPIIACLCIGAAVGNAGLNGASSTVDATLDYMSQATIVIALSLLLFSCDLTLLKELGGKCLLAFCLGAAAVVVAASLAWIAFHEEMDQDDGAYVAGLMTATLTGGTPNMAAAQVALGVDKDLFIATMTTDMLTGAVYIFAIVTIGKPFLLRILPPFEENESEDTEGADQMRGVEEDEGGSHRPESVDSVECPQNEADDLSTEFPEKSEDGSNGVIVDTVDDGCNKSIEGEDEELRLNASLDHHSTGGIQMYFSLCRRDNFCQIGGLLGLSVIIVLIGVGLGMLVPSPEFATVVTVITIMSLALGLSRCKYVRESSMAFPLGQYIILIFSVASGMLASARQVLGNTPILFAFVAFTLIATVTLHITLAKLFRIDADTLIVMSSSCTLSPPFVPMVTTVIGNQKLLLPGVTIGILGYAIGTYLGVGVGLLWKSM